MTRSAVGMDAFILFEILFAILALARKDNERQLEEPKIPRNVAFRRALGGCPACEGSLVQHRYALLASTRFDEDNRWDEALWDALSDQNWELVREFGCATAGENLIEAYAFRCPRSRRSGWFTLFFPVDETDHPFVSRLETLNFDATAELNAFVPSENWRPFVCVNEGRN